MSRSGELTGLIGLASVGIPSGWGDAAGLYIILRRDVRPSNNSDRPDYFSNAFPQEVSISPYDKDASQRRPEQSCGTFQGALEARLQLATVTEQSYSQLRPIGKLHALGLSS